MNDWQDWDYFDYHGELKSKRTKICLTCTYFRHSMTDQCVTILTCPFHQKLIPQGEHLIKGRGYWRENNRVFAPEVA